MQEDNLLESRLYRLVDEKKYYALYFLEGQKLIRELALIHPIQGSGFAFFRDAMLGVQTMLSVLKPGEWLGVYLDSTSPEFQLKFEIAANGKTRCLLMPEDFTAFPAQMTGTCRIVKLFPNNKHPYQSIIEIKDLSLEGIINKVFQDSYQIKSRIIISQHSDQSVLVHQLPTKGLSEEEIEQIPSMDQMVQRVRDHLKPVFENALMHPEDLAVDFSKHGYLPLGSSEIKFECNCSKARTIESILKLSAEDLASLFDEDDTPLNIRCEYCKTDYVVTRTDIEDHVSRIN